MYSELISFVRNWYQSDSFITLHEPEFGETDKAYVLDAIDSGFVSSVGEYVNRFEVELAAYLGAKRVVATVNGTAALHAALELAGVNPGDEVITQPLTFIATANAISYIKAIPVFVDVNRETLGLCPDALKFFLDRYAEIKGKTTVNKITQRRIAAIVPMHTFGHPCRMEKINQEALKWNIPIVEDAAEALGSRVDDKYCGTFGKIGILSFNGNKTITCGGGGAIITNDEEIADRAKHLTTTAKVNHPWAFVHDMIGYNYRMPNLNAALACAQLRQLDKFLNDKRDLARAYASFFEPIEGYDFIREPDGCKSNYWLNAVMTPDKEKRDMLLQRTNDAGIMTRPAWELIPNLPMYANCLRDDLSNARRLQDRIVNLPSSARKNVR